MTSTKSPSARGERVIAFGEFQVDRIAGHLRRGDEEIPLRAKSFALLRYLVENPGRLITRDELLGALWPDVAVNPSVVRVSIREVREALGEDPLTPTFIETVGRQGYRFAANAGGAPVAMSSFVGREAELTQLRTMFERCLAQRRQVVFIAGEAGIGKTALIELFVEEIRRAKLARVAQGQCVDLHGATEPYLPILGMLGRLYGEDENGEVAAILHRWAPSWLLQMPAVLEAEASEALRRRVPNPTRDRMLRELADAMEVLARKHPLVLVLEDLHWSDASTIDLLAYLAQIATPARLLVIASYRPVDVVVGGHPLRGVVRDVLARGRGTEIALEFLTLKDVETYLTRLFAGTPIDPQLAATIHARTDGNPLFMTTSIEHLVDRGILAPTDGRWRLRAGEDGVPPTLRELVARELDALSKDDQRMLAAASVVGVEFDTITVAGAIEQPLRAVEDSCVRLTEQGQFIQTTGTVTWPDGTIGGTYEFLHALHRDAVYNRLSPAERARLHRAAGERLEIGWARDTAAVAALLASHFERGADWPRAIRYHVVAITASKARLADREVAAHCEAVLSLLERLPTSSERDQSEMACALDLGASLIAARGYGAPEVEPLFVRARDLALALGQPLVEIVARGGLFTYQVMGGDQRRALELANDLLAMADRFPLPLFAMIGNTTIGSVHYNLGNLVAARAHFELAEEVWDPGFPRLQLDQKALFLGLCAFTLQLLGETAIAEQRKNSLIEYGARLEDPLNKAHAFELIAGYCLWGGDREGAIEWAERSLELSIEHGFPARVAVSKITKGHALGDLSLQRQGFEALVATGHRVGMPAHLLGMAETLIGQAHWDEARDQLELALTAVEATGEARHLAEIHRTKAAYRRHIGQLDEAIAELNQAIAIARRQGARLLEQRAAADLAAIV